MDPILLEQAKTEITNRFLTLAGTEMLAAPGAPDKLYHYTSAEGLKGILQSGQIYATNVLYLNDTAELADSVRTLEAVMESESKDLPVELAFMLKVLIPHHLQELPIDYFVVCFCEDGDLLSQWRAYGTQGTGYSIGFATRALMGLGRRLQKIEYDPQVKARLIKERFSIIKEVLKPIMGELEIRADEDMSILNSFALAIAVGFTPMLASMKNQKFSEEREWRLVIMQARPTVRPRDDSSLPVQFRVSSGRVVPYVSLSWLQGQARLARPIASLRHGPASDSALTKRALSDLLEECGLNGVEVSGSDIPLRA